MEILTKKGISAVAKRKKMRKEMGFYRKEEMELNDYLIY